MIEFVFTGCSKPPELTLEHFQNVYVNAGYEVKESEKPSFTMVNAKDGVMFYVGTEVVKIYEFKNVSDLEKQRKEFPFLADLPSKGRFVAESSSKELLEFFTTII